MPAPPAVVVVAYRADDELRACLESVAAGGDCVVVDNGSSPATRSLVDAAGACYVDAGGNAGFAAGVNRGLSVVGPGRDVLLLNPDARLDWSGVCALQTALHQPGPKVAAVGPALRHPDGSQERASWPMPSPIQTWVDALALSRWWHGRRFITGAALMLNADALIDVGPFDERYFLYAEESDWQRRAQQRGWSVRVVDSVVAIHRGAASSADERERSQRFHASQGRFARTWYHGWQLWVMRAGTFVGALRRSLLGDTAQRAENRRLAWSMLRRGS